MPIRIGNLPYDLLVSGDDFVTHGSHENLIFSGVVLFITLYSLEISTSFILSLIPASVLKEPGVKRKIARNLNECAAMVVMSWLGYVAFVDLGGFQSAALGIANDRVSLFTSMIEVVEINEVTYFLCFCLCLAICLQRPRSAPSPLPGSL
jgi:hypothetical protein